MNRREFLKGLGAAGATLPILPHIVMPHESLPDQSIVVLPQDHELLGNSVLFGQDYKNEWEPLIGLTEWTFKAEHDKHENHMLSGERFSVLRNRSSLSADCKGLCTPDRLPFLSSILDYRVFRLADRQYYREFVSSKTEIIFPPREKGRMESLHVVDLSFVLDPYSTTVREVETNAWGDML